MEYGLSYFLPIVVDPCTNNPCDNGGICFTLSNSCEGYFCLCSDCWSGQQCLTGNYTSLTSAILPLIHDYKDSLMDLYKNKSPSHNVEFWLCEMDIILYSVFSPLKHWYMFFWHFRISFIVNCELLTCPCIATSTWMILYIYKILSQITHLKKKIEYMNMVKRLYICGNYVPRI